jgi:periplasmic divalent cation tolerance protein
MEKFYIAYITFPSKKDAEKIAKKLLEDKLCVCCIIYPAKSFYLWKGRIEKAREYILIVKTLKEKVKEVETFIKKLHPYKIPFIGVFEIKVNKEYYKWAKDLLNFK